MQVDQGRASHGLAIEGVAPGIWPGYTILSLETPRQPVDGQQPAQGGGGLQEERDLARLEQVSAEATGPVGDGARLDLAVPVLPELVQRRGPQLGWHPQRRAVHGRLLVQGFLLRPRELAEEGLVHRYECDEKGRGRPLVKFGVVGGVVFALDLGCRMVKCSSSQVVCVGTL